MSDEHKHEGKPVPPTPLLRAADLAAAGEYEMRHPLNPDSQVHAKVIDGKSMSELTGMKRLAVHLSRIPPGKESFAYHSHQGEEEFLYILSGRGIAEIGDQEFEVGPGDFMGFATPSVAHHLRNPFSEDLIYLMGGERRDMEIADFPRLRKRVVRVGGEAQVVDWDQLKTIWQG